MDLLENLIKIKKYFPKGLLISPKTKKNRKAKPGSLLSMISGFQPRSLFHLRPGQVELVSLELQTSRILSFSKIRSPKTNSKGFGGSKKKSTSWDRTAGVFGSIFPFTNCFFFNGGYPVFLTHCYFCMTHQRERARSQTAGNSFHKYKLSVHSKNPSSDLLKKPRKEKNKLK